MNNNFQRVGSDNQRKNTIFLNLKNYYMNLKICKIHWTELDYQDNNDNLCFGLELLEDEQTIECFWFETDEEREQFILDNYMENNLI